MDIALGVLGERQVQSAEYKRVSNMRITVDRNHLLKSLARVHRVVERRNTIPILSNVLIDATKDNLELTATDLDLEVTETSSAQIEQAGATTVAAYLLYDIVRKLPDGGEIMLATDEKGSSMSVVSGRANFKLQCLPKTDFPEMKTGAFTHQFSLAANVLKRLVDCTQFAISTEETRYYLNGIYFHVMDSNGLKLRAVATDGHRLAQAQAEAPTGAEGMPGIIIPRKAVIELQKLLGEDFDKDVKIAVSENKIQFTIEAVVLTSKLIDGTFPDYQRVIPIGNDKKLVINRQNFSSAVDRVSTISSERGRAVKLTIEADQLTLSVNSPESGSAEDQISVQYEAEFIEIGFNSRYLLDITAQLTGEDVIFMLADSGAPTLIHDSADADALYVLMPMRV